MLGIVVLLGLTAAGWMLQGFAQPASAPAGETMIARPGGTATEPPGRVPKPTPSTAPSRVTLRVTEAEATLEANKYLAASGLPLQLNGLQIRFQTGLVEATASVTIGGFGVPVVAQAVVVVVDGKPVVTVQKVDVAGLGVPQQIKEQIRDVLENGLDQTLPKDLPLHLDDIAVDNGVMTITAHNKNRQQ
ncbi:MAG: hypothetical protein HYX94_12255 [Chloroflexi bacterium]|nr:hypothetical protein [Chloroflexota bacterium]